MTPIMGETLTKVEVAQSWARGRNAADVFIFDAIPALFAAAEKTGVRAEVLVAQGAHESGFGHFGRAMTPEHHQVAGIKVPYPGADDAADSHQRFDNWEQGATAHANHLRWPYCGLDPIGYVAPRSHRTATASWAGTVHMVEDLSTKWAPSETYHKKIVIFINEMIGTQSEEDEMVQDIIGFHQAYFGVLPGTADWNHDIVRSVNYHLWRLVSGQADLEAIRKDFANTVGI